MTSTLQSDSSPNQYAQSGSDLRREGERLKLLLDMTNTLVSNLVTRDLLRAVSASIRQCMHCDSVSVWLPDGEQRQLRSVTMEFPESKGFVKEDLLRPVEGSVLGKTFETGKPLVLRTAIELSGSEHYLAFAEGIEFCCCLPLISRNRTLGVLTLGWRDENAFNSEDIEFLMRVAGQVAMAIENALAYREIAELKDRLAQEKLYLEGEIRSEADFEGIIGQSS